MDISEKELRPILFARTEWTYLLNKAEGLSQGYCYKIESIIRKKVKTLKTTILPNS
ncbi:MAG: hypothetical protein QXP55_01595 [Nitrososphaerales archaeon]